MGIISTTTSLVASLGKSFFDYPWGETMIGRVVPRRFENTSKTDGERSGDQQVISGWGGDRSIGEDYGILDTPSDDPLAQLLAKFPCPPASHSVWSLMDKDPTIELVRGTLMGEILSVPRSYEAREGTPDWIVHLVSLALEPIMVGLLSDCFEALAHRWQPFEVVWSTRRYTGVGKEEFQVPVFFKPLAPELTLAVTTPGGRLIGVQQYDPDPKATDPLTLTGYKAFVFANEAPTGTPFGKSRHESCRARAWWPSIVANWMGMLIDNNESGSVFHVKGPPTDLDGAKRITQALTRGKSTYSSNFLATSRQSAPNAAIPINPQLAGNSAYDIEQFNLQSRAPAAVALLDKLRYYDSLKVRAWRKPERALLEGQHGTKAEAETHSESSRSDGETVCLRIATALNQWTINELVTRAAGEQYRDCVRLVFGSLVDRQKSWDERVIDAALGDPQPRAQMLNQLDVDAISKRRGLPANKNTISLKVDEPPDPLKLAKAGAAAKGNPTRPPKGNKASTGGKKSSSSSDRNKGKQVIKPTKG
jgi:hypothetical protein